MKKLERFGKLVGEFSDVADFFVVYIEEAHPQGGWEFNVSISYLLRREICLQERSRKVDENDQNSLLIP